MSEKTDGNWSFLSDDENDAFEEVPFEDAPPEVTETPATIPVMEPSATDNAGKESSAKAVPPKEVKQPDSQANDDAAKEAEKRAIHEAEEAKRKAEFDARQAAKKQAAAEQLSKIQNMSDEEITAAAIQRAATDTEKITRRNMKDMVTEFIQTLCIEDPAFARLTMHPRKSMIRCFQYISRKAFEYVQDEMKANGITPGPGMQTYGSDVPDDVCYQWAEDYFRDPTVKEDQEEEEKFVPKPYPGASAAKSTAKKASTKKKPETKKPEAKNKEPKKAPEDDQMSFGQLSMV